MAAVGTVETRGPMALLRKLPNVTVKGERVSEVLIYSRAGTGKSMGIGINLFKWCEKYPETRILVVRKTLTSLRESWQKTFEDLVLPAFGVNPPSSSRHSRTSYKLWGNGSEIVLGGLEDIERHKSTEWNIVLFVEGTEATLRDFEGFTRAMRWSKGTPFHMKIIECNPKSQFHWIYEKFYPDMLPDEVAKLDRYDSGPGRVALKATIKDNPHYWDAVANDFTEFGRKYDSQMQRETTGVDNLQLVQGLWCVDDGLVYEEFNPLTHVIDGVLKRKNNEWVISTEKHGEIRVLGFFASQDWGMDHPGVAQYWAVDEYQRICLVQEWYHTRWNANDWANIHAAQWRKLKTKRIVADGADANSISILNRNLTRHGGRAAKRIVVPATGQLKDRMGGRSLVSAKLAERRDGLPCIYFLRDTLQHAPDPTCKKNSRPDRTIREFPGYVMKVDRSGMSMDEPVKEKDDGMDAMRYAVMWFFNNPFNAKEWDPQGWVHPQWMNMNNPTARAIVREAKRNWRENGYGSTG